MSGFYALKTSDVTELERKNQKAVRELASGCVVLLENDGALPIAEGSKIALYGTGARYTVKGGTGSGDVNTRENINIEQGLCESGFVVTTKSWLDRYDELYKKAKKDYMDEIYRIAGGRSEHVIGLMFDRPFFEPDTPEITMQDVKESCTNTALFVITRNSGEGKDRTDRRGDYQLSEGELAAIRFLAKNYKNCIVLLNVGGVIDLSELNAISGVNAVLLSGQLGNIGGHVVADVLAGKSVPSGKLVDTWAKKYSDYPSSTEFGKNNGNLDDEYYKEGIYVGYRYFDTFGVEPEYCFGYGKSYTSFFIRPVNVSINKDKITVTVEVKNTGKKYAGREVVQVYASVLGGKIEKPYQELVAFAKTKLLSPDSQETLEITFPIASMASYDVQDAAWKLEEGEYLIRVGSSSRHTVVAAISRLDKTTVTSQVKNLFSLDVEMEELSVEGKGANKRRLLPVQNDGTLVDVEEVAMLSLKTEDISVSTAVYNTARPTYKDNRQGEILTLNDVKEGRATLDELIAQLSVEEMTSLCVGRFGDIHAQSGMIGSSSTAVPGAAADTVSTLIESRKIPNMILADGPAGLRLYPHFKATPEGRLLPGGEVFGMDVKPFPKDTPEDAVDYYQYCTAIPIASGLAQSWDMALFESMGRIVGEEMQQFHVHFWLAPGMNIHRNPLCGRNFEYYSEDPVISGKCAAAMTKGVQSYAGQGTTIKHYAGNNLEDNRQFNNSHIGERALREIYLKGFEIAVKESQPYSIMTSYNLLNGTHAANHYELIQNAARDEWGFEGVVMTDWFTTQDTTGGVKKAYPYSSAVQCIRAGNDLIMPGCEKNVEDIVAAVKEGKEITLADLQFCVKNILKIAVKI